MLLLLRHFQKLLGCHFTLSPEAEAYLAACPWYGNVRELRNWVEYLSVLQLEHLELTDVQRLLSSRQLKDPLPSAPSPHGEAAPEETAPADHTDSQEGQGRESILRKFFGEIAGSELHYYLVVKSLAGGHGQGVGRHTIFLDIQRNGYQLSEMEIRRIVHTLCRYQMAVQGSGRTGARVTPLGIAAYEKMREDPWLKRMLHLIDL